MHEASGVRVVRECRILHPHDDVSAKLFGSRRIQIDHAAIHRIPVTKSRANLGAQRLHHLLSICVRVGHLAVLQVKVEVTWCSRTDDLIIVSSWWMHLAVAVPEGISACNNVRSLTLTDMEFERPNVG